MTGYLVGLVLAAAIALVAYLRGSLSESGAVAAVAVGGLMMGAGGPVLGLALVAFFITSSLLSHHRHADKVAVASDKFQKGERRDAGQVLANGGVAAALALLSALPALGGARPGLQVAALGALAAATADTWATEIGVLARGEPLLVTRLFTGLLTGQGLRRVPTGTSGAVSLPGLAGSLAGATFLAAFVWLLPGPAGIGRFLAVLPGGVVGALADSVLGATVQERRRCPACASETEQRRHRCGAATELRAGVPGLDNDVVNALCTLTGAALAWLLAT